MFFFFFFFPPGRKFLFPAQRLVGPSKLISCLWETCSDLISAGTTPPSPRKLRHFCMPPFERGEETKKAVRRWMSRSSSEEGLSYRSANRRLSLFSSEVQAGCCSSIEQRPWGECWFAEPFLGHWEFDRTSSFLCCVQSAESRRLLVFSSDFF